MSEESTAVTIAHGIEEIFREFTDEVRKIGGKYGGKGKMGSSVLHWLAGSHVKTQRDVLCEKFLSDVQAQLKLFDAALEDADEEEVSRACEVLAEVLSNPVPANSNSTTDLMKRAMLGQLKPYLPGLSREKLLWTKKRIEDAYTKWQRLPVERDMIRDIEACLK